AISEIFDKINAKFAAVDPRHLNDAEWLKRNIAFSGELLLGHLRYGTYGSNSVETCHPFLRQNNWMSRNLLVRGNCNMTNVNELFEALVKLAMHPKEKADTVTVMENIGHFLDEENDALYHKFKEQGFTKQDASPLIAEHLDIARILQRSS